MASTRTVVGILGGAAALALLAGGGTARASAPRTKPRTRDPEGDVDLGPLTVIKTDPKTGKSVRTTDLTSLTPAERARYEAQRRKIGDVDSELLTDEQAEALEEESVTRARAELPGASAEAHERAKAAARKAAEQLRKRPANPSIDEPDDITRDVPAPPLAAPTPINLERARKSAASLARHLKTKGTKYRRQTVRDWQADAGIVPDGLYGPITRSALIYFGVANPPAAMFRAGSTGSTYAPPGE